eukprot:scpid80923/ scgid22888/ 
MSPDCSSLSAGAIHKRRRCQVAVFFQLTLLPELPTEPTQVFVPPPRFCTPTQVFVPTPEFCTHPNRNKMTSLSKVRPWSLVGQNDSEVSPNMLVPVCSEHFKTLKQLDTLDNVSYPCHSLYAEIMLLQLLVFGYRRQQRQA